MPSLFPILLYSRSPHSHSLSPTLACAESTLASVPTVLPCSPSTLARSLISIFLLMYYFLLGAPALCTMYMYWGVLFLCFCITTHCSHTQAVYISMHRGELKLLGWFVVTKLYRAEAENFLHTQYTPCWHSIMLLLLFFIQGSSTVEALVIGVSCGKPLPSIEAILNY